MQLHLFVMESERGGVVSRIEILFFMGINFYNDSVETFSMIPSHISNLTSCFPFPFSNLWVLDKLERKRILVQFRMSKNLNAFHIFSYHWFLFFSRIHFKFLLTNSPRFSSFKGTERHDYSHVIIYLSKREYFRYFKCWNACFSMLENSTFV